MTAPLTFEVLARDPSGARAGRLALPHAVVETPAFMPVGTQATVKAVTAGELRDLGASLILANAYHLWVRPGAERIAALGGLHAFMGWDAGLLTDSGGFQVMSLAGRREVTDEGVRFRSHLDGSALFLSPEECMRVQGLLAPDIIMALDECPALPAPREAVAAAAARTTLWAERCLAARPAAGALFGIVQGGADPALRERSLAEVTALPFDGFALGGLSVGEGPDVTRRVVGSCAPGLPDGKPRYLMGVGRPEDLVEAVFRGVDLFDCVLPTRTARNGSLLTREGTLSIKRAEHADDPRPIEVGCACEACRRHSRAYLRHLYLAGEILASRLNTLHNLHHVLRLMDRLRLAIHAGRLADERAAFWAARGQDPPSDP